MASITPGPRLRLVLLALCTGLGGCGAAWRQAATATSPATTVAGEGFVHRVYLQGAVDAAPRVHVYLEGDGRPFATRHLPAGDPTPRRRLAHELMARDPAPAIYLARPCYDGEGRAAGCTPSLWTDARYGETVVGSMAAALLRLRAAHRFGQITLIGYSGGGALAMLLAPRLDAVDEVVTIAANLDIAAWAALHGYTPLHGSLNPRDAPPLPAAVRQTHFVGERDRTVPPALVRRALVRERGARIRQIDGASHRKGWVERWPQLLLDRFDEP